MAKSLYRWGVRYADTRAVQNNRYFALFTNKLDAQEFMLIAGDRDLLVLEPIVAERAWG